MKGFRKSTRIAYWVLRALAVSSALLLFSIIGIIALQPASHATGLAITLPPTTSATSSPADMTTTPTDTPTPTPTLPAQPTPTPTLPTQPTPTPKPPTATPIPTPTKVPTPTATTVLPTNTPIVQPTSTPALLGPAAPLPTPPLKGTPKVTPSPSPASSPTPSPGVTPIPASTNGNIGSSSTKQQDSNGGTMATLKPLIVPIAGVSTALLLGSAGMLGVMVWRRRKAAPGTSPSFAASGVWTGAQASRAAPTELAPAQNRPMLPAAMQGIAQYSPLLGAPNTSQLDAPVAPPASDFRPLSIDYPQIMEVHTDKTPVPVTPASLRSLSPVQNANFQPALQLASAQNLDTVSMDTGPSSGSIRTPLPPEQANAPVTYEFPPQDPLMENLMQQVQMGIFALPGKGA